jgi:hypothetical protein
MEATASLDRLRRVLRANAAFSARGGLAALAACGADLQAGGVAVLGGIAVVVGGFALGQLRLRAKAIRVQPAYSTHE